MSRSFSSKLLVAFLAPALACGVTCPSGYSFYRTFTYDHTQAGTADSTNFPGLINTTVLEWRTVANGGKIQNEGTCCNTASPMAPFDLVFGNSAGSLYNWEMEFYNPVGGQTLLWVQLPTLSHTVDTVVYAFYDNPAVVTYQGNFRSTWDSTFLGVYHLQDGSTLFPQDSSPHANTGTFSATPPTANASGQIDGAGSFASASTEYIDLGTGVNPTALTYSIWVNPTSCPNTYNATLARSNNAGVFTALLVKSTCAIAEYVVASASVNYDPGSHTLSTGTWALLHLTYDSVNGLVGYVNGASDGTAAANGTLDTTASTLRIADQLGTIRDFNGGLDEARIANVARSSSWALSEFNNQKTSSTMVSQGPETSCSAGGTHDTLPTLGVGAH